MAKEAETDRDREDEVEKVDKAYDQRMLQAAHGDMAAVKAATDQAKAKEKSFELAQKARKKAKKQRDKLIAEKKKASMKAKEEEAKKRDEFIKKNQVKKKDPDGGSGTETHADLGESALQAPEVVAAADEASSKANVAEEKAKSEAKSEAKAEEAENDASPPVAETTVNTESDSTSTPAETPVKEAEEAKEVAVEAETKAEEKEANSEAQDKSLAGLSPEPKKKPILVPPSPAKNLNDDVAYWKQKMAEQSAKAEGGEAAHMTEAERSMMSDEEEAKREEAERADWEKTKRARVTVPYAVPDHLLNNTDIVKSEAVPDLKQEKEDAMIAHKKMVEASHVLANNRGYKWPLTQVRLHREKVAESIVRHNIGLGRVDDELAKVDNGIERLTHEHELQAKQDAKLKKHIAEEKEIKKEEKAWAKMKKTSMKSIKQTEKAKEAKAEKAQVDAEEKVKEEKEAKEEDKKSAEPAPDVFLLDDAR